MGQLRADAGAQLQVPVQGAGPADAALQQQGDRLLLRGRAGHRRLRLRISEGGAQQPPPAGPRPQHLAQAPHVQQGSGHLLHWLEQKRFSLRYMRDFGFGRRSDKLEAEIAAELQDLVELIRGQREDQAVVRASSGARSVLLPDALWPGFINGLLPVYCGARLPRCADEVARELGRAALQFQKSSDTTGGFLTIHPWLAWMSPGLSGYRDHTEGSDKMRIFLEKYIEEHEKTYSDDYMRNFIDRYLPEIREREKTGEPTAFTAQQLALILLDFFFPAASALSATLSWALVYMVHHPQESARVQREIDSVVGRGRLPTLDDHPNLPYTEAALREVMRIRNLNPISVPHKAMEDTTLQGYSVPKGTIVLTCLYSMHMDGDLWGDPNVFRPETLLVGDGKLKKKDFSLPFGAGKRLCAGETFARQNLFLTFSALMQNFCIASDGVPLPDDNIPGIIETAPAFWAQFVPRCDYYGDTRESVVSISATDHPYVFALYTGY